MGRQQRLERPPLLRGAEPVKGLGILSNVMVDVQHHLSTRLARATAVSGETVTR